MPEKIFEELRRKVAKGDKIPAVNRATFWMQEYATALTRWQRHNQHMTFQKLSRRDFTKQMVTPSGVQPGFFYFYMYDPKWKETLPYYDLFPFTLVLSVQPDRFLGLNFHYLDYENRARLFDLMYEFREGRASRPTVRDIRMRMQVTYDLLKASAKYHAFKPCLKEYLTAHLQTPLLKVGAKEWDIALFLPVETFVKETQQTVWRESRKQFR